MWKNVTKANPCPVCGKPDWCSVSEDGVWVACRRVDTGRGEHRIDRAGTDYWLYRMRPGLISKVPPDVLITPVEPERADAATLDRVYRRLLAELTLNAEHRENLRKRGLTDEEIDRRGYRSLPKRGRSELARRLLDTFGPETMAKVPGFYVKEEGERQWWSLAGPSGLVIPCRDFQGRVVALKVRTDEPSKGGKYVYVSSKSHGGPGPGAPVHIPLWDGPAETLRLTEGELKADVATVLSCVLTVSIPGVSCWRPAIQVLKAIIGTKSTKRILMAFDMDWQKNRHVAQALHRATEALVEEGFEVLIETWPTEKGKGIDDLLAVGEKPETKKQEEIKTEKVLDPVKEIIKKFEGDWPSIYTTENIRLIAGLADDNLARLIAEIKSNREAKKVVSVSKLEKLTKQARALLRAEAEERGFEVLTGGGKTALKTIVSAFPPAAEIIPENFPMPAIKEKGSFYDIREQRIVKVRLDEDDRGNIHENISDVVNTVVLLVKRVEPVEQDTGVEKWKVAWWERSKWRTADVPARFLFDAKRVAELIDVGMPVSSANVMEFISWMQKLRELAVLGHQGAPELPTVHAVSRCGWHDLDGERFFVHGREILRSGSATAADAGDRDEIQPDAGNQTDADIRWAEDLSAMERQVLASFRCGGDPNEHKKFLLDAMIRYPQVAFGLGCAAGAPLLRFARQWGLIEIDGFSVFMVPRTGGRSRHQGKSTWNAVVASLYGWPGTGPEGRLRYADATRAAQAVVFAVSADLTVHREELQRLGRANKKEAAQELEHLIYQASGGMDRDRAARGGGGRRTRGFHVILFGTGETDVTVKLSPEAGAHERVLKIPPLLVEETDENAREAERLTQLAMTHFGHAGREYIGWLVKKVHEEGTNFIRMGVEVALEELRQNLPTDTRRASAGRIASRAAIGLCGLTLLLEAWGVEDPAAVDAAGESFLRAWEMVVDAVPSETIADRALEAVQAYIAANQELIEELRDPAAKNPPPRWVGTSTEVLNDSGQKVQVIALTEPAFAEAVGREPYDLDSEHALRAMAAARYVLTRTERRPDGRMVTRTKIQVRIAGGARPPCVCIPKHLIDTVLNDLNDPNSNPNEIPF